MAKRPVAHKPTATRPTITAVTHRNITSVASPLLDQHVGCADGCLQTSALPCSTHTARQKPTVGRATGVTIRTRYYDGPTSATELATSHSPPRSRRYEGHMGHEGHEAPLGLGNSA